MRKKLRGLPFAGVGRGAELPVWVIFPVIFAVLYLTH